jgi:hypothetical protein
MSKKLRIALIALALTCGWYLLHRLGLRWGATGAEVRNPLPGDDLVPHPRLQTTHAITICAPRCDVWPWLVQMGYCRAGWYTDSWYTLVDKYLFRVERPASADHILPQLQSLKVGDIVPDDPAGLTFLTVAALEPERSLVLYSTTHLTRIVPRFLRNNSRLKFYGNFSWAFVLEAQDANMSITRLVVRSRADCGPRLFTLFNSLFLPPADFAIIRLMLQSIKQRAEGERTSMLNAMAQ